jgi:hypothetical protein
MFLGTLVTFLIQHSLGLDGMPRRVYEYDNVGHLQLYNQISTVGSWILAAGVLVTVINVARSLKSGAIAGPGPVEGEHARVVRALAAAGEQLRRDPARALARADEGHPPRGGAPLEQPAQAGARERSGALRDHGCRSRWRPRA